MLVMIWKFQVFTFKVSTVLIPQNIWWIAYLAEVWGGIRYYITLGKQAVSLFVNVLGILLMRKWFIVNPLLLAHVTTSLHGLTVLLISSCDLNKQCTRTCIAPQTHCNMGTFNITPKFIKAKRWLNCACHVPSCLRRWLFSVSDSDWHDQSTGLWLKPTFNCCYSI